MKQAQRRQSDTKVPWLQSSEDSTVQKEPGEDHLRRVRSVM